MSVDSIGIGAVVDPIAYDMIVLTFLPQCTAIICSVGFVIGLFHAKRRPIVCRVCGRAVVLSAAVALLADLCALAWTVRGVSDSYSTVVMSPNDWAKTVFGCAAGAIWDVGRLLPIVGLALVFHFVLSLAVIGRSDGKTGQDDSVVS